MALTNALVPHAMLVNQVKYIHTNISVDEQEQKLHESITEGITFAPVVDITTGTVSWAVINCLVERCGQQ